jgi:23S rRNA (cytidine1920-2'-O)/16S rRNA (cytidine1409-2'-O)-methyltransferase
VDDRSGRRRLDAELVRRGVARSRDAAAQMVGARRVLVSGVPAHKPSLPVTDTSPIEVERDETDHYVSRGALKLLGAIEAFAPAGLHVAGRRCLDAGSSTGGFTQVLLEHGAATVLAVDVGTAQLVDRLRDDPRVEVHEQTNLRTLAPPALGAPADLVVADLSFISLVMVLPVLRSLATPDADFVLMVKPQFEVGRDQLGAGGIVRDPRLRAAAVEGVTAAAFELGLGTRGVVASPLPGANGNVEVFCWFLAGAPAADAGTSRAAVGASA